MRWFMSFDFVDQIKHLKVNNSAFAIWPVVTMSSIIKKLGALELTKVPTADEHFLALKLERVKPQR